MSDLPVKTPEQLLVLASIIEKETGKPDERTRVAAVFVNRLKSKMKLQSDPTIIYGLVGGKGSLGRGILRSEISPADPLQYLRDRGPSARADRQSGPRLIEAAANPARTKELFFVADGTGGHAFSETYDQHQKHVAKLRGIEKDARDAAERRPIPPRKRRGRNAGPGAAASPVAPAARPANAAPAARPAAAPGAQGAQRPAAAGAPNPGSRRSALRSRSPPSAAGCGAAPAAAADPARTQ